MQSIPNNLIEWSEIRKGTGRRYLKENAPSYIVEQATRFEKEFYSKTSRRMFVNVNID